MQANIRHEFNLDDEWQPALVETVIDDNNAVFLIFDGSSWQRHKGSRGEESGQFRDKE